MVRHSPHDRRVPFYVPKTYVSIPYFFRKKIDKCRVLSEKTGRQCLPNVWRTFDEFAFQFPRKALGAHSPSACLELEDCLPGVRDRMGPPTLGFRCPFGLGEGAG